jgi:hypothetical protein
MINLVLFSLLLLSDPKLHVHRKINKNQSQHADLTEMTKFKELPLVIIQIQT